VYSVSGIVSRLRRQLEKSYPEVWVGGEISTFSINPASGHAYFSLKDQNAKLPCVLWRDDLTRLRFRPHQGQEVIVRGRLTIFDRQGRMQLRVLEVEPQGLGALQQEFTERLQMLRAEGLTSPERKRPIPPYARTIGVVTSPSGAALRDVLRTILRRDPRAHVIISPAQVQGRTSAASVAAALDRLDALGLADLIIVARGGGSLEDLWAFNEESVARAIVRCSVPVITGVGHETDTTIADYVADLRASTPTAAAEHAVPIRSEVEARRLELEARLTKAMRNRIDRHGRRLLSLETRLSDPSGMLGRKAQHLDELVTRAERALRKRSARLQATLQKLERRLLASAPEVRLGAAAGELSRLEARMHEAMRRRVASSERDLAILCGRLESMSPLAVLARGYAIAHKEDGRVVRRSAEVEIGERVTLRLAEGRAIARVEEKDV
jgi:exodeoxyribonuclease VII large subunit